MKFGMVTHFDPLKPSDGKNFELLKTKMVNGRYPDMTAVHIFNATQHGTAAILHWCTIWEYIIAPRMNRPCAAAASLYYTSRIPGRPGDRVFG